MGIAVLGPLEVDGEPGQLAPRDRVVLEVLAIRAGEAVSADRLADALWGETLPSTWSKVVQGCVVRLRKTLGATRIETSPQGYRLLLSPDEIDSRRFEDLIDRAQELLTLSEPERAVYVLGEALALWRGPPLVELENWGPGHVEADRLRELRRDAEELQVDAALRAGRARGVLGTAQTLVTEAPLRERRWALLALAQYQVGQQAQALQTLRQVRTVLLRELGLDPGPELVSLEQGILRHDPALVAASALPAPSPRCPYQGLLPYDVADSDTFFGREREVSECRQRLTDHGAVFVVGPSGCGKSSLVRAGLAAGLQRAGHRVFVVTPGARPLDALTAVPDQQGVALVVDQCEEAFTLCQDASERAAFFRRLAAHSQRGPLLVALRADRLGELSRHLTFARLLERSIYLLGAMRPDDLRACVERPARQAGLLLEPGLIDLLVREVEDEPGALPLLSHALRETWAHREGPTLTVAGYRATGGIRGAVARSAEDVYGRIHPDQRPVLRNVLLRLVTPSGDGEPVRSKLPRRQLADDALHDEVVEMLVSARLVTIDEGVLELAHEALARAWPRFRQWLQDDVIGQRILRHLSAAADGWRSMGRPDSELYRGVRLAQALEWRDSARPVLTPLEREFLQASRTRVDEQLTTARRQAEAAAADRRRTRRLATALAGALVLAVVTAAVATGYQRQAVDRAADAAAASTAADANRLAALSKTVGSLDLSLLLAAEALRTADTTTTRAALLTSLVEHRRATQVLDLGQRPSDVAIANRGRTAFVATPTEVLAWNMNSTSPARSVVSWGFTSEDIAASPRSDLVALWSWRDDETPRIGVFDSAGRRRLLLSGPEEVSGTPQGLGFSADGNRLVVSLIKEAPIGRSRLVLQEYDLRSGETATTTPVLRGGTDDLPALVDATGSTAVGWLPDGPSATLVRLGTGARSRVDLARRPAGRQSFHPLVSGVAEAWSDGAFTVYDGGGRPRQNIQAHHDVVNAIVVAPDRTWAVSGDDSGGLILWDVDRLSGHWAEREQLVGHDGAITGLAVDPAGHTLVSASSDGTLITWDLSPGAGFGKPIPGLGDRWISNRPQALVPGELLVAPTRPAPGRRGWEDQTAVSATFIEPTTGSVVDEVRVGDNLGQMFGSSVAVSPDRAHVAVTYGNGAVVLDARTREETARIVLEDLESFGLLEAEQLWCSAWTPDATRLLLCADGDRIDPDDGGLVVVDTQSWQVQPERIDIGGAAQTLEVSPDGRTLAAGMTIPPSPRPPPGIVKLLDADTLTVRRQLRMGRDDSPYDLSFSPDGSHLAVGVATGRLYTYDVRSGRQLHEPERVHNDLVQQVEWLPDGRTVVSTGADGTVTLYDAVRGLPLVSMPVAVDTGPWQGTTAFAKGFTYLISVSRNQVTALSGERDGRAYSLDPRRWLAYACLVAGRNLSRDEWASYLPGRPYRTTCRTA